jgi:hypothetical protein
MPLLGKAAMVLSFDVAPEAIAEHDDWHTHEHFPERLSIPGFLRGSRWVALSGQPRYSVLYEVAELGTLASAAYLERLNNPTPWTAKMMPHYRGMARGFCSVTGSFGLGAGHAGLLLRFKPAAGKEAALRTWLVDDALPGLPSKAGLSGAHLLESALAPQSTNEQRIRGNDAAVDWVLLVTGYSAESVASLTGRELSREALERRGATGLATGAYRMEYSLTEREVPGLKL